jgi:hypothetical protein
VHGKPQFHFEVFWTRLDGFLVAVEEAWAAVPASHCPLLTLSMKLKATAKALQGWGEKKVGHIRLQLGLARELLHQFDIAQDSRSLSHEEFWLRNNLKQHSLALASLWRSLVRMRSRICWLKDGDANTALFHSHARYRKAKSFIPRIVSEDGTVCTAQEEKADLFTDFYMNLLGSAINRGAAVDLEQLGVPTFDLEALDSPFSADEVWNTIISLPLDKAPGPDGFTGRFYKVCWSIIKIDVMAAISCVWARKFSNMNCLNSAYITLIPKLEGADKVKDFRPISLIHSFAKLVSKLMANRLACQLQHLVSPNQSAFIKKRFIQDNFMLVQHTTRFLQQQKQPRIMIKLDISKAFDSVSWAFLIEVLIRLGFGQIWCNVVCGLLSSSSTQILLNGCPGEVIHHRRGLRQGDPLSPMLFVLVMDVLNIMVQRASAVGVLQPLSSRFLHHRISLYADDVVVFLWPDAVDIEAFKGILHLFGEASGLKTNIQKSNVFPIHCDEEDLASVQASLPCQLSNFPCKYLGLPLSLKRLSRPQLQSIIDRIAVMLPGWKAVLMTKAGRAVYIQSVMTSRFVYLAMAPDLPAWAIKAIDRLRRAFLWKGGKEIKGGHCSLAWSKVTHPKELSGLGLFDLKLFGWALRVRWLWL